jgi:hypothetical protein
MIPAPIAWLIVIGQSLGIVALVAGLFGRLAGGGLFIIRRWSAAGQYG